MIAPSRELAVQTNENLEFFLRHLRNDPRRNCRVHLKSVLIMGGQDKRQQLQVVRGGVHMAIATPGRLNDLLKQKKMHLMQCTILIL